ncbi:MAG: hypothetical protein A2542_00905 [Parcubacteria group bacterium RIFOXYD2_FULL_52_8]|nr:MAG: hypothetical protein A2542_00905 [Parcubacteria group bacterium RIFOXYD2_FULL_52_8]
METYGIINIGSASKKYAFYRGAAQLLHAHFEHEGNAYVCTVEVQGEQKRLAVNAEEYAAALHFLLAHVLEWGLSDFACTALGIRVVAPGSFFQEHRLIDVAYREQLEHAATIAPLHIAALVAELDQVRGALPDVPLYAISDSAFHKDMPARARRYVIPVVDAERWDVYRFGYHGLSVGSVARLFAEKGKVPARMIICHLGGGASITALADGKSIDTSMGFTPDEGLPMATRVGNIDAGAVLYISEKLGGKAQAVDYFNHKSGLLGVSGSSADIRELLTKEQEGDTKAAAALELYVYQIQKQIGAYVATLGGLDALVFTGTVGERSAPIRGRVCAGLACFGVGIDQAKNTACFGNDTALEAANAPVLVRVVPSREMDELALLTRSLIAQ